MPHRFWGADDPLRSCRELTGGEQHFLRDENGRRPSTALQIQDDPNWRDLILF
jgi:hypothetical protein